MPASQPAASERRTDKMTTPEPPKLKTTLKTPPKPVTNPLQFVKVGPCALYRSAQEQLQKVEEVKKIKQEVREDPEDWQSNLDNWKSSRRKRQEHIIERVVEVKKLELEEHDRQRRRSKTFSEMMEERGSRGRKMSVGLAVYHEEDANDLSDLGIGTSSGKSSVSGDTHDDAHSVLSDRDSEIEKNHSDVDNATSENGNSHTSPPGFGNGFHSNHNHNHNHNHQEYDSATTATASSPEPEEYTYEGAIRGYVSRVSQNIPRRSLVHLDNKVQETSSAKGDGSKADLTEEESKIGQVVKVDILKRREIFEKASQQSLENKGNRLSGDFTNSKSIKERLSNLEKQKIENENTEKSNKNLNRLSGDMSSIRERLSHLEKKTTEREMKNAQKLTNAANGELDAVRPLRERLSTLEKYSSSNTVEEPRQSVDLSAKSIKDRLTALDAARNKEIDKRTAVKHGLCCRENENRIETSTPSERSSSPDSEYRVPRAPFHRSLDSLDADASSGPDTFERVQSLEELDYARRYPASSSSAELLNDTDREDSGIHTADVSCSVSQADETVDDDMAVNSTVLTAKQEIIIEEKLEQEITPGNEGVAENVERQSLDEENVESEPELAIAGRNLEAVKQKGTADTSGEPQSTNKPCPPLPLLPPLDVSRSVAGANGVGGINQPPKSPRPVIYQSPKVPPRRTPPQTPSPKPKPVFPVESSGPVEAPRGIPDPEEVVGPEIGVAKSNALQALALEAAPRDSAPLTPPSSPISTSTPSINEIAEISGAVFHPSSAMRSVSKIPTPLPRKTVNFKSTPNSSPPSSPDGSNDSSATNFPSKLPTIKARASSSKSPSSTEVENAVSFDADPSENRESLKSQIPVSIPPQSSVVQAPTISLRQKSSERRHTVVEVCEKVLVPRGEGSVTATVTPFITVARVGDEENYEVRIDEKNSTALRKC